MTTWLDAASARYRNDEHADAALRANLDFLVGEAIGGGFGEGGLQSLLQRTLAASPNLRSALPEMVRAFLSASDVVVPSLATTVATRPRSTSELFIDWMTARAAGDYQLRDLEHDLADRLTRLHTVCAHPAFTIGAPFVGIWRGQIIALVDREGVRGAASSAPTRPYVFIAGATSRRQGPISAGAARSVIAQTDWFSPSDGVDHG